ncbi:hypothetical protein CYY_005253 [Polysphondylium violaceum]|uniref:Peptidase S53 domain-containing protein n=1 Tax=Polysphondylium violaceum TaxID=133409 RepID=A0A8J4Q3I7_9MYCE|nr:hypothetical protein CYY_005253 [Polysphondylium violaceum]
MEKKKKNHDKKHKKDKDNKDEDSNQDSAPDTPVSAPSSEGPLPDSSQSSTQSLPLPPVKSDSDSDSDSSDNDSTDIDSTESDKDSSSVKPKTSSSSSSSSDTDQEVKDKEKKKKKKKLTKKHGKRRHQKSILVSEITKSRKFVEHKSKIKLDSNTWKVERIANYHSALIELTFGIKQQNLDRLEQFVWEVSDPNHANYGKHMKFEQVKELVKPKKESIKIVQEWLEENNIKSHKLTDSGDFIKVTVPIEVAEALLQVAYNKMVHRVSKVAFYRSLDPYTLPIDISDHVDFVGGVNHLPNIRPSPRPPKSKKFPKGIDLEDETLRGFDPYLTPKLIRQSMNVTLNSTSCPQNSQAIAQFLQEYYSETDLLAFQKKFELPSQKVSSILGPNIQKSPGMETALDIQYILAMAPNTPTWVVSTAGLHEGQEPFLDWLVNISSMPDLPLVHSISYGDDESSIEKSYTDRVDTEFKKYAAMGRTIVFSSGDFGVGCNSECNSYSPGWPASSRFVLAIGGVILKQDGSIVGDTISGGGFSNYFSRPSYQDTEVSSYLNYLNGSLAEYFNSSGRGYPDISSFSENVLIVYKDSILPIGGTSASAPIIAGLLTLINDQRLLKNKSPIGFFNPLLYKISRERDDAFIRVTSGENNYKCCKKGFKATKDLAWNPISGLGVPNFGNLLDIVMTY